MEANKIADLTQENITRFEILFKDYFDRVFQYVFSRTNNRQIAEDLTSQIFNPHPDGIHLTVRSDPIEASDGIQLTFVNAESLYYENSSLIGVGFDPRTNQLKIWLGMDSLSAEKQFAVKITSADLTILEPFKLTWNIKP